MASTSSKAKRKYNKSAYVRYEFSVRIDSSLAHKLEEEKDKHKNISGIVKELLCKHYGVSDADIFIPEHLQR